MDLVMQFDPFKWVLWDLRIDSNPTHFIAG